MRVNPGGILAPEDVVGRDELIGHLWRVLDTQSVVLTSERRVGKTSVIRKMVGACGPGRLCFLRDVEALRSPAELIEAIYSDVQSILTGTERAKIRVLKLLEKLGGTEIKDVKLPQLRPHWKTVLAELFADILDNESRPVIFFWDELPLFIYNILASSGPQDAMELLDALRALRQKYASLRMVFTGSVGIHQVIGKLREHGYANDPTNDMATIEVPPLLPHHGSNLAGQLLAGEKIKVLDNTAEAAESISAAAGHIPYYVHCIIARILNRKGEICSKDVPKCLQELIADPDDPAHFQYYQTRLSTYYSKVEAMLSLNALDALARSDQPLGFSTLLNLVRHKTAEAEEEQFRSVLQILQKDHYLVKLHDGTYSFRYSIVQHWWAFART